jgi:N-acetylglutamate synthase-like GNAT family acetyltransferase
MRPRRAGSGENGATRTTPYELAEHIAAGQIAVATRHGQIAGIVRIHDVSQQVSEFGMLVAAPDHRGTGVGRAWSIALRPQATRT